MRYYIRHRPAATRGRWSIFAKGMKRNKANAEAHGFYRRMNGRHQVEVVAGAPCDDPRDEERR